ncbi:hypothetical protein NPX13_g10412 [Xylaria arbuscula]|uniref:Uncharacterized protein n=1 Tax=Xylaria arbuscula TaxID=114810 RepID=A0A9W8N4V1_9PEZI|nr:hypothetical protein NPX13_g10412 [Xylaria arbuscula]
MSETEDLDSGLLGIALSDSEGEPSDEATSTKKPSQEARTGQSEADFQEVKRTYRVKVENGEVRIPNSDLFPAYSSSYYMEDCAVAAWPAGPQTRGAGPAACRGGAVLLPAVLGGCAVRQVRD